MDNEAEENILEVSLKESKTSNPYFLKVKVPNVDSSNKIILFDKTFDMENNPYVQVYDIDESNKTIDMIMDYSEILESNFLINNPTKIELVESVARAHSDNFMLMKIYPISNMNNDCGYNLELRPRSHSERSYSYLIYTLATDKQLIYKSDVQISYAIPKSKLNALAGIYSGLVRQNKLYEQILDFFNSEVCELAANLPNSFFEDLKTATYGYNQKTKRKTLTTTQKEDPPNLSLKDRLYNN